MPLVSLGEAARLTGHGKSTIARSIKSGRLSATRTDVGSYEIDTSELYRVYPFQAPMGETPDTGATAQHATPDALADQVAALREVAALLRSQLEDVREDRDQWRDQAKRLAIAPPESTTRSWWWWKRRAS